MIPLQAYPLSLQETIRLGNIWLAYGTDVSSLALPSSANESISSAQETMTETREHASASPHTQEFTPHTPLPLIDNPQQILTQVRNGNAPDDWKVFHSQKVSFQELRSLMIAMDRAFMRALALVFFLALSTIPLMSALAEDDKGITFIIFLLTICVDVLAVAFFVMMMVEAIDQAPAIRMETPQKEALLVLTPEGFVEYIDDEQMIDTVSFGAISLMQQRIEEDDQAWLDIAYVDHRQGQWTPRAQFGPIRSLTKQIFQAFLDYTERYNHLGE